MGEWSEVQDRAGLGKKWSWMYTNQARCEPPASANGTQGAGTKGGTAGKSNTIFSLIYFPRCDRPVRRRLCVPRAKQADLTVSTLAHGRLIDWGLAFIHALQFQFY